jgi:hypothetical protein
VLASDDEEIVVVDPSTYPGASSATLRPASPADSVNSIRSITTVSVPAAAGEVPSDARDRVRADEVVVLTEECTNTTRHCIYMCDYPSNT